MNVFLFVIFLVGKDGKIHLLCTVAILFNFVIVVSLHLFSFCMCLFVVASDCILITFALSISTITRDFVLHYKQIVLFFILFLRFCFFGYHFSWGSWQHALWVRIYSLSMFFLFILYVTNFFFVCVSYYWLHFIPFIFSIDKQFFPLHF